MVHEVWGVNLGRKVYADDNSAFDRGKTEANLSSAHQCYTEMVSYNSVSEQTLGFNVKSTLQMN